MVACQIRLIDNGSITKEEVKMNSKKTQVIYLLLVGLDQANTVTGDGAG